MNKASDILSEAAKRDAEMESGQVTPLTKSEFLAATDADRKTIHECRCIRLDEAESQRLVEALLAAPCAPTPRFSQAHNTYQKSVVER